MVTKDGTYRIQLDQHTCAPVLHIGSFDSEGNAQAWITDESAAWLAERRPRQGVPNRRRGRVGNVR